MKIEELRKRYGVWRRRAKKRKGLRVNGKNGRCGL